MPDHVNIVLRGISHHFPIDLCCTLGDLQDLIVARLLDGQNNMEVHIIFRGKLWKDTCVDLTQIGVKSGDKIMTVARDKHAAKSCEQVWHRNPAFS